MRLDLAVIVMVIEGGLEGISSDTTKLSLVILTSELETTNSTAPEPVSTALIAWFDALM